MSASYNHVVLLGNCTRDPELKYTPGGTALAEFSIAINRTFTSEGEKRERVDFFDIQLWGKTGEVAHQYLKRGNPVLIAGRLQQDTWEDKNTHEKKSRVRVVGETMQLLGSKPEGASSPTPSAALQEQRARHEQQVPEPQRNPDLDIEPDDIPF